MRFFLLLALLANAKCATRLISIRTMISYAVAGAGPTSNSVVGPTTGSWQITGQVTTGPARLRRLFLPLTLHPH